MAFRRMRRAPRGRRRTKTLWDRAVTLVEFEGGLDPMLAQTIGDPRILPGSLAGFDLLRTVRRIIVNMNFTMELDLNVVAQGDMVCGIYVGDRNAPVISPLFLTSGELEADWLDLNQEMWDTQFVIPTTGDPFCEFHTRGHRDFDTKSMRKQVTEGPAFNLHLSWETALASDTASGFGYGASASWSILIGTPPS